MLTTEVIPRMSVANGSVRLNPGKDAGSRELTMVQECREALELWLQWDEQHRGLTELLFDGKHEAHRIEELLDACDVLRQRAVELSQRVLKMK